MSYLEHFKFDKPPFGLSPDPEFVYWSKQHSRAKAYMESTIWLSDGFVVITGEIGSGKTTLLQSFLGELGDDVAATTDVFGITAFVVDVEHERLPNPAAVFDHQIHEHRVVQLFFR